MGFLFGGGSHARHHDVNLAVIVPHTVQHAHHVLAPTEGEQRADLVPYTRCRLLHLFEYLDSAERAVEP